MTIRTLLLSLTLITSATALGSVNAQQLEAKESSTIAFDSQEYQYQWSNQDLHEFTPNAQSVNAQWIDMMTVNYYPMVSSVKDLGIVADAVLSNYKNNGGIVLGFESIAATDNKPAEYIIGVVFGAPDAAEFAMVKFQLHDGVGASVAYAHREYGTDVGGVINDWMEANATRIQDKMTTFSDFPPYSVFQYDNQSEVVSSLDQAI